MGVTNNLKHQVDLPIVEWCRFAPAVSTAVTSATSVSNSNYNALMGRYVYFLIGSGSFWAYDTWGDCYIPMSPPPIAPATYSGMQFLTHGYEGHVISATGSTITLAGFSGQVLENYEIDIVSGTGAGQRRMVIGIAEPVLADQGVVTAVSNTQGAVSLTDTTKTWTINQWVGYQVRIASGSGVGQIRKILYNSANTLYVGDSTKHADESFANPAIYNPAISATAGSQTFYSIESHVATVDTAWDTAPDSTSRFRLNSGNIILISSAASAPFFTLQHYDVLTDIWYVKTASTPILTAASAEASVDGFEEASCVWTRGTASSGTTTTLTDTTQNWVTNQWVGYNIWIWSGTGRGQVIPISANTATGLTWTSAGTAPDATSQYYIIGYGGGTASAGTSTTLTDSSQSWLTNQWANYVVKIVSGTGMGQYLPILSNTATVLTVIKNWVTTPDTTSKYLIVGNDDIAYYSFSGIAAIPMHTKENDLITLARPSDLGTARQGGSLVQQNGQVPAGMYAPLAINTITHSGTTATVTTVNSHTFKVGQTIKISGATGADASIYNGAYTIVSVPSTTTLTYTMGSTPASNAIFTGHTTTTLTDSTKSWTTNQWANYLISYMTSGVTGTTGAATITTQVIVSNTATTLTFNNGGTAPTNGISRYVISNEHILGGIATGYGTATGGSTTTIVDTTQTWVVNYWAGQRVRYVGGTGMATEAAILSNTSNTLTFAATTAAAAGTAYSIVQQNARGVGANLMCAYNMNYQYSPNGQYVFIARGGATAGFDRLDITTDYLRQIAQTPYGPTLTTGANFAYDGANRIYFYNNSGQGYLYYLDLKTYRVHGAGVMPYTIGTSIVSNRMEIFTTIDGLNYIWLNRESNLEVFRLLLMY